MFLYMSRTREDGDYDLYIRISNIIHQRLNRLHKYYIFYETS